MNDHIKHLLIQRQYNEDIKDEAIVRVLFNGESVVDVAESLEIHSFQAIWVFRSNDASDFGQTVPLKRSYNYIKKL